METMNTLEINLPIELIEIPIIISAEPLYSSLLEWLTEKSKNGIKQHDANWFSAKKFTIGGSSIATIQGLNPFATVESLISEKLGVTKFESNIKPQWGNLFESVLRHYTELDKECTVFGHDLYIEGPSYTAYSPDGLAIMNTPIGRSIVLCEFKCPYSRLPRYNLPPVYYVPQVKMGLDLLKIADIGLLIEGIFRRCSFEQYKLNVETMNLSTQRNKGNLTAMGTIGFYIENSSDVSDTSFIKFANAFFKEYTFGDSSNNWKLNDLGSCSELIFTLLFNAYDKKIIKVLYGKTLRTAKTTDLAVDLNMSINKQELIEICTENKFTIIGILPWKLFDVYYNYIEKDVDYINKWLPEIKNIIEFVKECDDPNNDKLAMFDSWKQKLT